jgi:hypothetical protein
MKTTLAILVLALIPQDMPQDAQKVIAQADLKLEALRRSYEESCAKVKAQELKDLQRIHDAIEKGNPAGATAIKTKIDVLAADVVAVVKGGSSVEQWLQGKWVATLGGAGDVIEFRGDKIVGSGIGDRTKGKVVINGSTVQLVWDSGYVETMRVPQNFGDEATGTGRSGALVFKRLK